MHFLVTHKQGQLSVEDKLALEFQSFPLPEKQTHTIHVESTYIVKTASQAQQDCVIPYTYSSIIGDKLITISEEIIFHFKQRYEEQVKAKHPGYHIPEILGCF